LKFVIEAAGLTVAGGKELALDLMTHLGRHRRHQFTCIVPDQPAYQAIRGDNLRTIVRPKASGLMQRAWLLNRQVPRICREEKADALLCLGNFVPWKRACPTAVLLQNAWIVYGDPVAESRRTLREHLITVYGRQTYRYLGPDLTIVTQTPVMRDRLCERYGIAAQRVAVIPNALSRAKLAGNSARAATRPNEAGRPFAFLCLAHCYPHKNIAILAEAARLLPNYTGKPARCVITVAPQQHPGARRLLAELARDGVAGKIENIGPVESEKLPQVYESADALILPTLLESFSRTYLEAFHFGLPILTSDRDFAHHLCGHAALYFDPLDAASVARAMAAVMEDSSLRQMLVETGRRTLAQAPTWEEIASRFVEVLENTARGRSGQTGSGQVANRQWADGQWADGKTDWVVGMRQTGSGETSSGQVEEQSRKWAVGGLDSTADLPICPPAHLPAAHLPTADVRALFNREARRWRSKYGPKGKLNGRLERFQARLAELCPPPARILDLGCGTGEIAAAIDRVGYRVTACDLAEEMIAMARRSHVGTGVEWVWLEPGREALPFAERSFEGVLASSVFEYLDDVEGTAAELARVLCPEGILLLTVPNPCNVVRKFEARLQSLRVFRQPPPLLRRVQRLDSYAAYLRLSRNRFAAPQWQAVLKTARFTPLDARDFSHDAWQRQAQAPLVLLAVKRAREQS